MVLTGVQGNVRRKYFCPTSEPFDLNNDFEFPFQIMVLILILTNIFGMLQA